MSYEKQQKRGFWQRWLCLMIALVLVASMAACGTSSADTGGSTASTGSTAPSTTQSTQSTSSTATEPSATESTGPDQPEPESEPLEYTLTQADVDEFYRLLAECEALAIAGEDMDAIEAASDAMDESYVFLNAQCSIATILHYSHTKDAALEQQYLDCVEICTQAGDAYTQMARRVYQSDTPAKEFLFEGWTDEDIASLLAYDEQVALLQQRNAEIGVEYRTTEDDARKIELYIEFVGNNNAIAAVYGYDNYYSYAYERVYGRDYDAASVSQLRQYAKTFMVDIYYDALMNFYYSYYEDLPVADQRALEAFLYDDHDSLKTDYVGLYLDSLPETMGNTISTMLQKDSLFADAEDAMPAAFTTAIGDRCYCFFGPGYGSTMTVIHEGGHYFAGQYADISSIPLDLAEVHSQGNEWLFIRFLEDHMGAAQYDALVDYLFYENASMILICLMVDEFEQAVYSTDLTGFSAADFDAIMDNIALQYFPDRDVEEMLADMNLYWRMVVVEQPIYYISYAVSAIGAISLYTMAEDDYSAAMAAYQKLCQEPVLDEGFLGNLLSAGLCSPFDEQFYIELKQIMIRRS